MVELSTNEVERAPTTLLMPLFAEMEDTDGFSAPVTVILHRKVSSNTPIVLMVLHLCAAETSHQSLFKARRL